MIVYVRYGTRLSGKVDACAGSYVATRFFHIYYIPLIPLSSWLVLGEDRAMPMPMQWRSVLAGYLRGALTIAAAVLAVQMLMFFSSSYHSLDADTFFPELIVPLAAIGGAIAGWAYLGRLSKNDRGKRAIYWDAIGYFVDPAQLGDARHSLIEKLRKDVYTRAKAITAASYREQWEPENKWRELAAKPSMNDLDYLKAALTLCRLEWSFASGAHRAELAKDHALIFENIVRHHPQALANPMANV